MPGGWRFGRKRRADPLPVAFRLFFAGQTISNLGSAFTTVAVPLLVYRITGSATDLAAATAVNYLPFVVLGLPGGAVVDRVDRRRAMVIVDIVRAATICVIPALAATSSLTLGSIYAVEAVQAGMQVIFTSGEFAAVAALVERADLVRANSLIQGSYAGASLAGSALAGLVFAFLPIADSLYLDGFSFLISAASLVAVRQSFNEAPPVGLRSGSLRAIARSILSDTRAGLDYVWHHRLLRTLSLQLMVVNLFGSAANAEIALYASRQLGADNSEVGFIYAASSIGVVGLSLLVGPLNRRLRLATMILLALSVYGAGLAVLGLLHSYPAALVAWAFVGGATVLYNVSSGSLRQQIVPDALLGRASSIALTGAWCAIPIGALGGGVIVATTHDVGALYVAVGTMIVTIAWASYRLWMKVAAG